MRYEHIGYNSEWVASLTQKDFLEHERHQSLTVDELKEVHRLCKAKHKEAGKPVLVEGIKKEEGSED